jgi:DNA-binding PadR family transcriptional regulator
MGVDKTRMPSSLVSLEDDVAEFQEQRLRQKRNGRTLTDFQIVCFEIIEALKDNAYGLNISETVGHRLRIDQDPAQIYDLIRRQRDLGRLEETLANPPNSPRKRTLKVYSLTELGRTALQEARAQNSV